MPGTAVGRHPGRRRSRCLAGGARRTDRLPPQHHPPDPRRRPGTVIRHA
ncbi:hypothetical protein Ae168Ps1_5300 [Pseudonocardia sp. Ae168_Ps1]|nr:hypothetical protein Ae150APs1_5258 [Pseudonocardia sp. Ae150A_Ps1]OLL82894.1 hypothetical protein Ae168Ps1_5300 [Pseudonocardia sp. Ae168_Ps1]OLL82994.1 hypothetical protein Ae263Ps1_0049c [Pseudonocardia sp. Ae263_Ps1]OLL90968.1 hypothetical protein Ae356Ps1_0865 [Pseudonocardia sp. Ae356_Ps1]